MKFVWFSFYFHANLQQLYLSTKSYIMYSLYTLKGVLKNIFLRYKRCLKASNWSKPMKSLISEINCQIVRKKNSQSKAFAFNRCRKNKGHGPYPRSQFFWKTDNHRDETWLDPLCCWQFHVLQVKLHQSQIYPNIMPDRFDHS